MKVTEIREINELLTKSFQQECVLVDELKLFYKLKFPGVASISEFEALKRHCENFLSQFDIKISASIICYPQEGNKLFILQINKPPLDQLLEKLIALSKNSQFYEALHPDKILLLNELLDKGANINTKNIFGDTPLHVAIQKGYERIASLLIERGALILPNNNNETVLQIVDQKKEVLLGKSLISALLKSDLKIDKPDFKHPALSSYWDEQQLKRTLQDDRKVNNIIKFFSLEKSYENNHVKQQGVAINLSK